MNYKLLVTGLYAVGVGGLLIIYGKYLKRAAEDKKEDLKRRTDVMEKALNCVTSEFKTEVEEIRKKSENVINVDHKDTDKRKN